MSDKLHKTRTEDNQMDDIVLAVHDLTIEVKNLSETFQEHEKKILPMYEWFQNINFTKRAVMWMLGFVSAVGGLVLLLKQILK